MLSVKLPPRDYQLHAQPGGGHLQPGPLQREPGHEPAAVPLLHRLLTQHLPDGGPAHVPVQGGHVRLGAAGRLPLRGRSAGTCGTSPCRHSGTQEQFKAGPLLNPVDLSKKRSC